MNNKTPEKIKPIELPEPPAAMIEIQKLLDQVQQQVIEVTGIKDLWKFTGRRRRW